MLINTRLALNVWIENREKWEEIKEQINKTFHCILCILILSNFYDWIKISFKSKLYTALWHKRYSKLNNIFVNINFRFYCYMIKILYHKILKYMSWIDFSSKGFYADSYIILWTWIFFVPKREDLFMHIAMKYNLQITCYSNSRGKSNVWLLTGSISFEKAIIATWVFLCIISNFVFVKLHDISNTRVVFRNFAFILIMNKE